MRAAWKLDNLGSPPYLPYSYSCVNDLWGCVDPESEKFILRHIVDCSRFRALFRVCRSHLDDSFPLDTTTPLSESDSTTKFDAYFERVELHEYYNFRISIVILTYYSSGEGGVRCGRRKQGSDPMNCRLANVNCTRVLFCGRMSSPDEDRQERPILLDVAM